MTVFHLLRHGEHELGRRVLAGRMPGVGLSERGRAEIAAVAERLAGEGIAGLYSSPLQRTRESAEIVGARLGLPVVFHDDLIELDFGEWTGSTFDAIRADPRWEPWRTQRSLASIPGGESMREVQRRAVEAMMEISEQPPRRGGGRGQPRRRRSAASWCSRSACRSICYGRLEVGLGSLSTIRIDADGIRVLAVNERPRFP